MERRRRQVTDKDGSGKKGNSDQQHIVPGLRIRARNCWTHPHSVFDVENAMVDGRSMVGSKRFSCKLEISKNKKKVVNCIVMATLWIIWSSRNEKVFKVVQFSNAIILEQVNECTMLWMNVIAKMEYLMENLVTEEWYTSGVNVIEN